MTDFSFTPQPSNGIPQPGDGELLRQFAAGNGQAAFTELVRRHSGLVFSTALRRSDSPELAQEAAQNVFTALARKAPRLASLTTLTPWLHRAAVLESAALIRRETRYRQAMKRRQEDPALAASALPDNPAGNVWESVKPLVDDALNALSTADREVLLLHHGEGWTFREIATRLGLSAEAAQRRGHRALEKLASRLRRRGLTVPALALGVALTSGLMSDASAAAPALTPLIASGEIESMAGAAVPVSPFPAWIASPVMLVALGLTAGGFPIWWRVPEKPARPPAQVASKSQASTQTTEAQTMPSSGQTAALQRNFLAEALAELRQSPADAGPTKLGLQLRKYMLSVAQEDLRATGKLLKGYPTTHREMIMVVEAFSARLAELDPALALELVQNTKGKAADPDFSNSIDRPSLLDVLTRNFLPSLMEVGKTIPVLMISTLESLANHDGPSAMKYTAGLLAPEFRAESYRRCFYSWVAHRQTEALLWLDGHFIADPDRSLRLRMEWMLEHNLSSIVRRFSPQETLSLVPLLNDDQLRNDVLATFFHSYGDEHPEVMVQLTPWLRLEDEAKPVSVASLVFSWRKKDPAGLAAWVDGLPTGELKQAAVRSLRKPNPFEK